MKDIRNYMLGLLFVAVPHCLLSQVIEPDEMRTKSYEQIVQEKEQFYRKNRPSYEEGSEYNEFLKWKSVWGPRIAAHRTFDDYFEFEAKSFQQNPECDPELIDDKEWLEIGPTRQPTGPFNFGEDNGQPSAKGIGPTEQLVFAPSNSLKMLVSSLSGGLWYSSTGGNTWIQAGSDKWPLSGSSSAAFHPSNTNTWFATSVDNNNGQGGVIGKIGGVYRTQNSGISWTLIGDFNDFNGAYNALFGIKVDPIDPDIVFMNSDRGLYRTTNSLAASVNWTKMNIVAPASVVSAYPSYDFTGTNHKVWDFEFRPVNPSSPGSSIQDMYATVQFRGTHITNPNKLVWRLMRSSDGGITWSEVITTSSIDNLSHLNIETTKADRNILGVLFSGSPNGIYHLNLNTFSWTLLASTSNGFGSGHSFGISQQDANILYYRHSDRYRVYNHGTVNTYTSSSPNKYDYHVDMEDFVSHPTNEGEVWMCNHGGVARSINYGVDWETKTNGMGVGEVMDMMTARTDASKLLIASYHDGSSLTVTNHYNGWDPDWHTVANGDGVTPMIDRTNPKYMWANAQWGQQFHSSNFGLANTFSSQGYINGGWESAMGQHAYDSETIYWADDRSGGANADVRRSFDRGQTYSYISDFGSHPGLTDLVSGWHVTEIESARSNQHYLYTLILNPGGSTHKWYLVRTTEVNEDDATIVGSWEVLPLPNNTNWMGDIEVDPENPNIVYVVYSHGTSTIQNPQSCGQEVVFKMDYTNPAAVNCGTGANCTDMTYNLPAVSTGSSHLAHTVLAVEQGSDGGLYFATRSGAFYTNNKLIASGDYWQRFGTNLPYTSATGMEIAYDINRVRMSFAGRGVWEHDLHCPEDISLVESAVYTNDEYFEVKQSIESTAKVSAGLNVKYRAGRFVHMKPGFRASKNSVFHAFIHRCDVPGNSFKRLYSPDGADEIETNTETEFNLSLYPNPNNGEFMLDVELKEDQNYTLEIFDLSGKLVWESQQNTNPNLNIDIQDQPDGMYIVRFRSGSTQLYNKLIKR